MKPSREGVYECTYASSAVVRTAHVRAWDAREALELFADELRGDGVVESGEIRVEAKGGRAARTKRYRAH